VRAAGAPSFRMAKRVRVNPNMLLLIAYDYTISFATARRAQLPHG